MAQQIITSSSSRVMGKGLGMVLCLLLLVAGLITAARFQEGLTCTAAAEESLLCQISSSSSMEVLLVLQGQQVLVV
jgi:hypothetical protein